MPRKGGPGRRREQIPFHDDPGRLARRYAENAGDDDMSTPAGRRAAARGLADTYGVSEKAAAEYLYFYFPNTLGRSGSQPRRPVMGSGKATDKSLDYQCEYCHTIFAGPDYGYRPRSEITRGPSGAKVSHGFCDAECHRKFEIADAKKTPDRTDTSRAAITARENYRRKYLRRGK